MEKPVNQITIIRTHPDGSRGTTTFNIPDSNDEELRKHLNAFIAVCDHLSKFEEDERFG